MRDKTNYPHEGCNGEKPKVYEVFRKEKDILEENSKKKLSEVHDVVIRNVASSILNLEARKSLFEKGNEIAYPYQENLTAQFNTTSTEERT